GKKIYGYLLLKSQSKYKVREHARITEDMKNENPQDRDIQNKSIGSLLRKPLKSKDNITPKNYRLIPIWDEDAWKIIKRKQGEVAEKCFKKIHGIGTDREDYYLLPDIEENNIRREFR